MSEPIINVKSSNSGALWGLFFFLSMWLVFGRGLENQPSSFEHWLNAHYHYRASNANWNGGNDAREPERVEEQRAFEVIDGELIEQEIEEAGEDSKPVEAETDEID